MRAKKAIYVTLPPYPAEIDGKEVKDVHIQTENGEIINVSMILPKPEECKDANIDIGTNTVDITFEKKHGKDWVCGDTIRLRIETDTTATKLLKGWWTDERHENLAEFDL